MQPLHLEPEEFAKYPPEARMLIVAHLEAIRQLPVSFVPNLLREAIDYDFKFPAERSAIEKELTVISSLTAAELEDWFRGFAQITLSPALERFDWVNQPARFAEQESAYLWTTHQQDAFRDAATAYGARLLAALPPSEPPVRRLGIAIIGQGVAAYDAPLFRDIRAQGTYFGKLVPENGLQLLLAAVGSRAKAHPVPYGHWYVDGGDAAEHGPLITCVSYKALDGARAALLKNMQAEIRRPGMGPEELRTHLAELMPSDLGMEKAGDPVLDRFQVKLLTEGSGTQIFSTTFAQWTAREALRRAQPLTLLVRFAPRQRQRPMSELLSNSNPTPELDFTGSLIDADMGAFYHWINQQRLPGASQSVFLAWFEGHQQAVVVSPSLPRGVESMSAIDLGKLLDLALS
ncbi:conserved hypothetical protein [Candidatus Sulfotelmatomonas gaucii]|uniref:Uncharacterized protein n=1 Tax=Candidatus Sulfuritelmatomonas gaucii TaxID=2043161 RepID=A0A2N9L2W9_9BACT|nr:conserved hypothetical protein [Candidatus Sulfotelmatomonas gaucii]